MRGQAGDEHGGPPWFKEESSPAGWRELLTPWGDERVRSLSHRGAVSFKLRFTFLAEVWRAECSGQVNIKYDLTSISLSILVVRNFRLNCILKQDLRRYEQHSQSPNKPPF